MIAEMLDGRTCRPHPGRRRAGQLHRHPRRHRRRAGPGDRLGRAAGGHVVAGAARRRRAGGEARSPSRMTAAMASCSSSIRRRPLAPSTPLLNLPPERRRGRSRRAAGGRLRRAEPGRGARLGRGGRRACRAPPMRSAARRRCALCAAADLRPRARRPRPRGGLMSSLPSARSGAAGAGRIRRPRRGDDDHDRGVRTALRRGLDPVAMRRNPADDRRLADARPRRRPSAPIGFSLLRTVADEAELLLLAVAPDHQRPRHRPAAARSISSTCARAAGARRLHLEVRDGNPAVAHVSAGRIRRRPAGAAIIIAAATGANSTR